MALESRFTYENQGTISFLVYNLKDEDVVDTITSGMLLNNKIEGLIPYAYSQVDTKRYFKYNITSKVTLKNYFSGSVTKRRLVGVLLSIASAILDGEDYLINVESFVFDSEFIYVDVSNYSACLVCLPISDRKSDIASMKEFAKNIMYSVQFDQSEDCDYVAQIINFLNNSATFSIAEFKRLLENIMVSDSGNKSNISNTMNLAQQKSIEVPNVMPEAPSSPIPEELKQKPVNPVSRVETSEGQKKPRKPLIDKKIMPMPKVQPNAQKATSNLGFEIPGMTPTPIKENTQEKHENQKEKKGNFFSSIFTKKEKSSGVVERKQGSVEKNIINKPIEATNKASNRPNEVVNNQLNINPLPKKEEVYPDLIPIEENIFEKTTVLTSQATSSDQANKVQNNVYTYPYLILKKTQEKIEINKEVFKLGQEPKYVDYLCTNPAVSRSHADIISRNNEYFIRDNNSTNGTFVNKTRITSNQEIKIKHEDEIVLANEVFEFRIY
ncbi:MAG: FHA domain-containing protein [Clostridiaceae bacterium]|jgi:hypothetical protein|nr:FHA domain-containing protein [Clostridiaceae bacterium]